MNNQFENMQKLAFGKVLIKESMENKKYTREALKAHIREIILTEMSDPSDEFDEMVGNDLEDRKDNREITDEQFQDALDYLSSDSNSYDLFHEFGREDISSATDAVLERMTSLDEAKKKKKKDVAPQDDSVELDMDVDMSEPPTDDEVSSDTMTPEVSAEIDIDPKVKSIQDSLSKALANAKALGDEKLVQQIGNTITMLVRTQVVGQQAVAESLKEIEYESADFTRGYDTGYKEGYKDGFDQASEEY